MSIRKRLILSNIAMIMIPPFLFLLACGLLIFVFFGQVKEIRNLEQNSETTEMGKYFRELRKISFQLPEKLEDASYLIEMEKNLNKQKTLLVVRKGQEIIFYSKQLEGLPLQKLPAVDEDGESSMREFDNHHYNVRQYDFFFRDGTEGTIFFLRDVGSLMSLAHSFFPLLLIFLLLVLIATNGLLTYFVSRSIIRPVKNLTTAAEQISEGQLDFHIKPLANDELGKLSQTFEMMRQKLKESKELQLQYEENRKELLTNISHDLKTPITSIKGYVEGIQDGIANTPEKMEKYLQTIYTKSMNLDHLIDELFLYSKLDLHREPFTFEEVDVRMYFEDLVDELHFELEKENVNLTLHTDGDAYQVIADREKLKRVVTNVIGNSLRYMNKEEKQIQIELQTLDKEVLVSIIDNGSGIPNDALPYIFDRFYRVEASRNRKTGGTGLGLSIVKRMIEEHGGRIWASSNVGEGMSIFFTLRRVENNEESINY